MPVLVITPDSNCRGGGGGRRVGSGQPDVQGESPRLGPKAHQHQNCPNPQKALILHGSGGLPHPVQLQGAQLVVEQKQSGQGRQAANYSDK